MKSYRLFILLYFFLLLIFTNSYGQDFDIVQTEDIHDSHKFIDSNNDSYAYNKNSVGECKITLGIVNVNYVKSININIGNITNSTSTASYTRPGSGIIYTLGSLNLGDNTFTLNSYVENIMVSASLAGGSSIHFNEISMIAEYRSVAYDYDIAGNRTRRYLSIQSLKSGVLNKQQEANEGTLDWDKLGVKLYPNPTHGQLLLEFKNYPRGNLPKAEVYSLSGQQMVQQELSANPAGINIEGFPEGTYILKLWVGNEYRTYQIIKR